MKRPKLKPYLLNYINTHEGWIKKVDLYIVGDEIEFSPESVGRTLRDLEEEGGIKVDYYNGKWAKNLAKYARLNTPEPQAPKFKIVEINGERKVIYNN